MSAPVTPSGSRLMASVPADPYPWPWDGAPDPDRLVLVAAGWDTHWRARVIDPSGTETAVTSLAVAVAVAGGRCVWLHHDRPARAPIEAPDPEPLAIPSGIGGAVLGASGIDGFAGGPLDVVLRRWGADQLLLVGHGLEATAHSTMRSANDRGYECLLVVGACSALTPDAAAGAVASVTMSGGIFGAVATHADTLAALAGRSESPAATSPAATSTASAASAASAGSAPTPDDEEAP